MPINKSLSKTMKRRNFLKLASLGYLSTQSTLLTGCTHKKFYYPDQDIIIGGGRFKKNAELHHVLAATNLQQKDTQLVETDFLPHGIIIDPNDKKRLITFEKNGHNAAEIDLNNHTVSKQIQSGDNKIFSGHGVFDKSGDVIYCVETELSNHKGKITVRDGKSLAIIDELSSFGKKPHQCQLIDDDKVLVVSNTGNNSIDKSSASKSTSNSTSNNTNNSASNGKDSQTSITYIDIQNKNLLERRTLSSTTIDTGHFSFAKDGSLVVSSAPKEAGNTGGVSIGNNQQPLITMTEPETITSKLTGEALSICIDERNNVAAVTHPSANLITFWSIDKKELVKAMSVPDPRGITLSLDKNHFIVSYAVTTSAILVDTKTLTANTESIMQPIYASGEHIINWSRTLTEIMPGNVYS